MLVKKEGRYNKIEGLDWEFFGVDDWKNFMEGAVSLLKDVVGEKDNEEDI